MDKKEMDRIYYQKNRERLLERRRQRYQENKEKELAYSKKYVEEHKDEIKEYLRLYQIAHNEELKKYKKEYYSKMISRAMRLAWHYKNEDLKHNRGESTITPEWIVENIFSGQKCYYCGESDWTELGCDRIDNSKPHTPDNVVPCCAKCNKKRGTMDFEEFKKMLGI